MELEPGKEKGEQVKLLSFGALKRFLGLKTPAEKTEAELNRPAFHPLLDRGGRTSLYSGACGPIVTLAKVSKNVSSSRPAGEGLPIDALNQPDAP